MAINSATTPWVLEADGIQLQFGQRRILSDVYIRVQTGQVVGLMGRNGCGKSTLLQTIFGGRHVPDASVRVNGRYAVPAYQQPGLLNYLPQTLMLPAAITVAEAAQLLRIDGHAALAAFPELQAQLHQRIGELSGGTSRLVQVLLLLHADTRFSLLDEPFSGVMPVHIETLSDVIQQVKVRKGLLITDHRFTELLPLCDVVYMLHNGRLEELPDPLQGLRDRGYLAS
ncbi:ATP-binding cassette domain-containing protein [Hymenobacter sp. BT186]|uniref:ATP-binding cassette domain-containing protein n=1 Tax=Hymenobacter telluris TaxID=2816474 RepID=A0A939JCD5_9BACT|nr:ATP-binding cassette domain-containing protein [Hymenobacter telluris]MBO0360086.1 ATP-binding cassette domain-containing protein [Hymenobacter telluris]MBW3376113.1 ATP-binding cassette domain-containing protein [Hymenobacter norwichensis]